ncbi:MAG: MGMT family protein [Actinomycetes bacterium]
MDEEYLEAVLDVVAAIPAGRVMTYGTIAEELRDTLGRGGPRQVGAVLSRAGSGVPWWRVVNASGLPPSFKRAEALAVLRTEGCPLAPDGSRVRLHDALWWPPGA